MTKVVLVCVAGVSGTFLAKRMRDLDSALSVSVATLSTLPDSVRTSDVILVAPQLATSLEEVRLTAGAVPVAVLPASAYGVGGADIAVRAVNEVVGALVPTPDAPSEEKD